MLRRTHHLSSVTTSATAAAAPPKLTINYMCIKTCNFKCKFCFSTYDDPGCSGLDAGGLKPPQAAEVVRALAASNLFDKITFAGGEPLLRTDLYDLLKLSKDLGLKTSVVTNGSLMMGIKKKTPNKRALKLFEVIDQLAFSIDSCDPKTRIDIGRAFAGVTPLPNSHYLNLVDWIRANTKISLKLNTVVSRPCWQEDMNSFLDRIAPERWKVFQVLPVAGQNDEWFDELKITDEQFKAYLERHKRHDPVFETNDLLRSSYLLVDPWGRFFDNSAGGHTYSQPLLEVGIPEAMKQCSFDFSKYEERGGVYEIRQPKQQQL